MAGDAADDTLLVCPGVVYRRDAIDRLHTTTPHQLDLWRISRRPLGHRDLEQLAGLLVEALTPGRPWRWEARVHPYTLDGHQLDVRWDSEWVDAEEAAEDLGDRVREALGPDADAVEEVAVLAETGYEQLPAQAVAPARHPPRAEERPGEGRVAPPGADADRRGSQPHA